MIPPAEGGGLVFALDSAMLQLGIGWASDSIPEVWQMTHSALPSRIREMPVPDRVALVEQIWDSIVEDEAGFELTATQKAELDRRLAERASSMPRGSDWADAKRRILEQP